LWDSDVRNEDELTFVFFKGGAGKCVSPAGAQLLSSGDVLTFNGGAGVKLYGGEKSDCLFSCFSLRFEYLFPLFASDEISLLHDVTASFRAARIYPKNHALAVECQQLLNTSGAQSRLEQRGQLLRIASAILSAEFKNAQIQRNGFARGEDHMVRVFEKLSSAELLNLSVEELAAKFSCSRRHLNRLFHQHFGLSIAALRMEMRLLKAVSLLRDPEIKVISVAEQCGFNHLGLFNTCFKRRYGTSPGQWRKSTLSAESGSARKTGNKQICPLHINGLCPWGGPVSAADTEKPKSKKDEISGGSLFQNSSKRESKISNLMTS
jgi:AraC-like DNA-binding protein